MTTHLVCILEAKNVMTVGIKKIVIDKDDWVDNVEKAHYEEAKRRQSKIEEGLCLFGKYFQHLWW